MPSVYDLKPRFQQLLRPLMHTLAARGFTPNKITLMALGGSFAVGGLLMAAAYVKLVLLVIPFWMFVRMALNALDGMMAREMHMQTAVGGMLNEVGDVLSDLALFVPLAYYESSARGAVLLFCAGAVLTEFCGLLGVLVGSKRQYHGPMGKSDRAFAVSVIAIATVFIPLLHLLWFAIFYALAALEGVTCWNRAMAAVNDAAKAP